MGKNREALLRKKKERRQRRKEKKHPGGIDIHPLDPRHSFGEWRYPGPAELEAVGPVIKATWSIPPVLANVFTKLNRPIPPPVTGYLLVDTGATKTCISEHAAQALGLKPVGTVRGYGAGGETRNNQYEAHIELAVGTPDRQPMVVSSVRQVQGIPDLDKHPCGLYGTDKQPIQLIGLLGRDFLRYGTFKYYGTQGRFELVVDPALLERPTLPPLPLEAATPVESPPPTSPGPNGKPDEPKTD